MFDVLIKAEPGGKSKACAIDSENNWRQMPEDHLHKVLDALGGKIDELGKERAGLNDSLNTLKNVSVESERREKDLSAIKSKIDEISDHLRAFQETKSQVESALMPSLSQTRRIEEFGGKEKFFEFELNGKHHRERATSLDAAQKFALAKESYLGDLKKDPEPEPKGQVADKPPKPRGARGERVKARIEAAKVYAKASGAAVPVKVGTRKGQEIYTIVGSDGTEFPIPQPVSPRHPEGHPDAGKLKSPHQRGHEAITQGRDVYENLKLIANKVRDAKRSSRRRFTLADYEKKEVARLDSLKTRIENAAQLDHAPHQWDHTQNNEIFRNAHAMTPAQYRQAVRIYYNSVGSPEARGDAGTRAEKTVSEFYNKKLNALRKKDSKNFAEKKKPILAERDQFLADIRSRLDHNALDREHAEAVVREDDLHRGAATDDYYRNLAALKKKSPQDFEEKAEKLKNQRDEILNEAPSKVLRAAKELLGGSDDSQKSPTLPPLKKENLREKHKEVVSRVDKHFAGLGGHKDFDPPSEGSFGISRAEALRREGFQEKKDSESEEKELRPWLTRKFMSVLSDQPSAQNIDDEVAAEDYESLAEDVARDESGSSDFDSPMSLDDAMGSTSGPSATEDVLAELASRGEEVTPSAGGGTSFLKEHIPKIQAEWEKVRSKNPSDLDKAKLKLARKWAHAHSIGSVGSEERRNLTARKRGESQGHSGAELEDFIKVYGKQARDRGRTDTENANLAILKEWVTKVKSRLGRARQEAYRGDAKFDDKGRPVGEVATGKVGSGLIPIGVSNLSEEGNVFKNRYEEKEKNLIKEIISSLEQGDSDTPYGTLSYLGKHEIKELLKKSFDWIHNMNVKDVFPGVFLNLNLFKNFNASEKDKVRAFENSFGRDTSGVNPSTMNSEIEGREEDEDSEDRKSKLDKSLGLYVRC
jgi:hypothetical protein